MILKDDHIISNCSDQPKTVAKKNKANYQSVLKHSPANKVAKACEEDPSNEKDLSVTAT